MLNSAISLGKRQLVDSIWKSAGIEGLGTTFPDTEAILNNLPVTTSRDEVLFMVNMKRAWQFLFDNVDVPNNLMLLRELNKITMYNILYAPGSVRREEVSINGTTWKPAMPNEGIILQELDRINGIDDEIERALEMFCYVIRTQMFLDGNKRVAQLITNKILMQNDIGIFSLEYDKIKDFYNYLVSYYETNDSAEFKKFLKEHALLLTEHGREVKNAGLVSKHELKKLDFGF